MVEERPLREKDVLTPADEVCISLCRSYMFVMEAVVDDSLFAGREEVAITGESFVDISTDGWVCMATAIELGIEEGGNSVVLVQVNPAGSAGKTGIFLQDILRLHE